MQYDEIKQTQNNNLTEIQRERELKAAQLRAQNASTILNKKINRSSFSNSAKEVKPFDYLERLECSMTLDRVDSERNGTNINTQIINCDYSTEIDSKGREIIKMTVPHRLDFLALNLNPGSVFIFDRSNYRLLSIEQKDQQKVVNSVEVWPHVEILSIDKILFTFSDLLNKEKIVAFESLENNVMRLKKGPFDGFPNKIYFQKYNLENPIFIEDYDEIKKAYHAPGQGSFIDVDYNMAIKAFNQASNILETEDRTADFQYPEVLRLFSKLKIAFAKDLIPNENPHDTVFELRLRNELNIDGVHIYAGAVMKIDVNDPEFFTIKYPPQNGVQIEFIEINGTKLYAPGEILCRNTSEDLQITSINGGQLENMGSERVIKIIKANNGFIGLVANDEVIKFTKDHKVLTLLSNVDPSVQILISDIMKNRYFLHDIYSDNYLEGAIELVSNHTGSLATIIFEDEQPGNIIIPNYPNIHPSLHGLAIGQFDRLILDKKGEFAIFGVATERYDMHFRGVWYERIERIFINFRTGEVRFRCDSYFEGGKRYGQTKYSENTYIIVDNLGLKQTGDGIFSEVENNVPKGDDYKDHISRTLKIKEIRIGDMRQLNEDRIDITASFDSIVLNNQENPTLHNWIYAQAPFGSIVNFNSKNSIIESIEVPYDTYIKSGGIRASLGSSFKISGIRKVLFEEDSQNFPLDVKELKGEITITLNNKIYRAKDISVNSLGLKLDKFPLITWEVIYNGATELPDELLVENNSVNIPTKNEILYLANRLTVQVNNRKPEDDFDLEQNVNSLIGLTRWLYESANKLGGPFNLAEWVTIYKPLLYYYYNDPEAVILLIMGFIPNSNGNIDPIDYMFLYATYLEIFKQRYPEVESELILLLSSLNPDLKFIYKNEIKDIISNFEILEDENKQHFLDELDSINMDTPSHIPVPVSHSQVEGFKADQFSIEKGFLKFNEEPKAIDLLQRIGNLRELSTSSELDKQIEIIKENGSRIDMNVVGQISQILETIIGFKIEGLDLAKNFVVFGMIINFANNLRELKNKRSKDSQEEINIAITELQNKINRIKSGELTEEEMQFEMSNENVLKILMHMTSGTLPKEYLVFTILMLITSGVEIAGVRNVLKLDQIIKNQRGDDIGVPYLKYREEILEVKATGNVMALQEVIIKNVSMLINYMRNFHNYEDYSEDFLVMCKLLNLKEGEFSTNCFGIGLIYQAILDLMIGDICEINYATLHHELGNDIEDWFKNLGEIVMAGHAVFIIKLPLIDGEENKYIIGDPLSVINSLAQKNKRKPLDKHHNCMVVKESELMLDNEINSVLENTKFVTIDPNKKIRIVQKDNKEIQMKIDPNDVYQVYKDRNSILTYAMISSFRDLNGYLTTIAPDEGEVLMDMITDSKYKGDRNKAFEKYMLLYNRYSGFEYRSTNSNQVIASNIILLNFALENDYYIEALFLANVNKIKLAKLYPDKDDYDESLIFDTQKAFILTKIANLDETEILKLIEDKKYLLRKEDITLIWENVSFINLTLRLFNETKEDQKRTLKLLSSESLYYLIFDPLRYNNIQEMKDLCKEILKVALENDYLPYSAYIIEKLVKLSPEDETLKLVEDKIIKFIAKTDNYIILTQLNPHLIFSKFIDKIHKVLEVSFEIPTIQSILNILNGVKDDKVIDDQYESLHKVLSSNHTALDRAAYRHKVEEEKRIVAAVEANTHRIEEINNQVKTEVRSGGQSYQSLHQEEKPLELGDNYIKITEEAVFGSIDLLVSKYGELSGDIMALFLRGADETVIRLAENNLRKKGILLPSPENAAKRLQGQNLPLLQSNS
ncbi:MAG: hypothetical protein ABI721_00250 [Candidatus Dojkabacteria bacterium]